MKKDLMVNKNPIYYKSVKEIDKPVNVLLQELQNELTSIRGKMYDINSFHDWKERTEYIDGTLTCLIISMSYTIEEIKKFEEKNNRS